MNKKGQTGSSRKVFSIILGLIFLILGSIPLLNTLGVIDFSLPDIPLIIFWVLALLGALVLIIDGFSESRFGIGAGKTVGALSILLALVLIIYGLGSFGILPFALPDVGMLVINILFTLAGILLIIGGFSGF
ncbi:hypothetical protein KY348_03380 [Candidatus Woesearchaeota archaeon]|nr:hypothetical protein [Candidatus Woesearchaeota archaeon]